MQRGGNRMAEIKPWDSAYEVLDKPEYDSVIRKLKTSDPANADTVFNPLFQQVINNIHAVKLSDDTRAKADLSNVSKDKFKEFVEDTGVAGADGSVAAKDLSNVSGEDFQVFMDTIDLTGANGNVAPKPRVTEVTLTTGQWVGSQAPYTQAVTVQGVVKNADSESLLYVAAKQEGANMEMVLDCGVTATALSNDSVTFSAAEGKPTANVVFQIINAGVVSISGGEA